MVPGTNARTNAKAAILMTPNLQYIYSQDGSTTNQDVWSRD